MYVNHQDGFGQGKESTFSVPQVIFPWTLSRREPKQDQYFCIITLLSADMIANLRAFSHYIVVCVHFAALWFLKWLNSYNSEPFHIAHKIATLNDIAMSIYVSFRSWAMLLCI